MLSPRIVCISNENRPAPISNLPRGRNSCNDGKGVPSRGDKGDVQASPLCGPSAAVSPKYISEEKDQEFGERAVPYTAVEIVCKGLLAMMATLNFCHASLL